MIGRLTGVVIERGGDGGCVLDVQGVGYEVFVPLRSVPRLPAPPAATTLYIHTHVREDQLRLFGFESPIDRSAFRVLMGVAGIATKLALAVLGDMDAAELGLAVARADHKRLTAISGVGKKTAERMLLELKDKLPQLHALPTGVAPLSAGPQVQGRAAEVAGALAALGFSRAQADHAASSVVEHEDARPIELLVRLALGKLG
ncbi:MAG TPA: Holliday junction branch migration protein RuvA [Polyangiales bacterium]|nr:Holliday junction branch migration protein RuvA [Polyangiales bacterium]